ncbi:MAG: hypothetical protein RR413_10220, partial [Christensenellaceae bacterium]
LEVSTDEKFLDINIEKAEVDKDHILLRACQHGKPNLAERIIDGISYKLMQIADKYYVPER